MPSNSSWRTIELQGGAPWGFRLTNSINQIQPGLKISKVRTRSNAYNAGLRDNDIILSINDIPTHSMTLQQASDLIDSCQRLTLSVFTSSLNKNYDENQHNFVNENNINYHNLSLNVYNKNNNNLYNEQQQQQQKQQQQQNNINYYSNKNFNEEIQTRNSSSSSSRFRVPSLSNAFNNNLNILSNSSFNKFNNYNNKDSLIEQLKERQQLQKQKQININNNPYNQKINYIKKNFSSMRRNYYSATESCGEETDIDDSVFVNYDNNQPKQSYASITLRTPLKDVNYYSDTETLQTNTNTTRNYNKFKQQQQQQQQQQQINFKNPIAQQNQQSQQRLSTSRTYSTDRSEVSTAQTSLPMNNYQKFQSTPKPFKPVTFAPSTPINANTSTYNNKQSFSLLNRQAKPFINQSTDNPYSPSPSNSSSYFKVPNIYDKLNFNQQPQQLSFNTNNNQQFNNDYVNNIINNNDNQINIDNSSRSQQEDLLFKKYESEMGTELMKQSEKPNYSDSYFYNNPSFNYPTIDDQKRLAKVIASTLEGSDPDTSKYHKLKKKQLNSQSELDPNDSGLNEKNVENLGHLTGHHSVYAHDENIPEVIRKSIQQAEKIDPVRQVFATEEFKQQHFTEHTTHTEMPPQAAMSLAAALHQSGGRGAQIFQKRKAKSEKWVVDESTVRKPSISSSIPPPIKFNPPEPEPTPILPRKPFVLAQKFEDNQQNKYSDFNSKPRGWNSGEDYNYSSIRHIQPRLSIDKSIREGIQELHFSNEQEETRHVTPPPPPPPPPSLYQPPQQFSIQPNKLDLANWNAHKDQHIERKTFAMSKDGIQNIKQRLNADAEQNAYNNNRYQDYFNQKSNPSQQQYEPIKLNENFTPIPTISKVKLNKLNTNDFFTNPIVNRQHQQGGSYYQYNDDVASSDL